MANRFLILILSVILLIIPAAASAQSENTNSSATLSSVDAKTLVATLEDDQKRKELIQNLHALIDAQNKDTSEPTVFGSSRTLLSSVSTGFDELAKHLTVLGEAIASLPSTVANTIDLGQSKETRDNWLDAGWRLLTVILVGYAVTYLVHFLVASPRSKVQKRAVESAGDFIIANFASILWMLLPLIAFFIVSNLTVSFLDMSPTTKALALIWIRAMVIARFTVGLSRIVFAPEAPDKRWVRCSTETAHYLVIWVRRLVAVTVYGYLLLLSAKVLGMSGPVFEALLRVLGLITVALLIVFVLQNRTTVERALRAPKKNGEPPSGLKVYIGRTWAWFACLYLVVGYSVWALNVGDGFSYLLQGTMLSTFAIVVTALLYRLFTIGIERFSAVDTALDKTLPGLSPRLKRYIPLLQRFGMVAFSILALVAVLVSWGVDVRAMFWEQGGKELLGSLVVIGAIIVGAIVCWELFNYWIESTLNELDALEASSHRVARRRTLLSVARKGLSILIVTLATLLILSRLGIDTAPLLATAGVLGLAIGFGAQKLVQDVINGVFILAEDLFSVGDVIEVNGTAGLVENVNIRNVRLRDFSGVVHTVPFSSIETVSNMTKDFSCYVFDVGIAYQENVDNVIEVLHEIGRDLRQDPAFSGLITADLEVFGLDRFDDSAVVIKARIKTLPIQQWTVGREFNKRMKKKFDELGIEIPFPHRTMYFGEIKDGKTPRFPLDVPAELIAKVQQ